MKSPATLPGKVVAAACAIALALAVATAHSQSIYTWNGGGGNGNWSTGGNWAGGTAPSNPQAILNFAGSTQTTSTNNLGAYDAGYQILFNSGAGAFTLDGEGINFYNYGSGNPGIENDSTGTQTVNLQCDMLATGYTFNVTASAGNINLGASTGNGFSYYGDNGTTYLAFNANNGNTITVYGAINNGSGAPVVSITGTGGGGTVIFDAAMTYSGGTTINSGTLALAGNGTLYSGTAGTVAINNGGTLRLDAGNVFGNAGSTVTAAAITVNAGGTLASNNTFNQLNGVTFDGGALIANGGSFGAAFGLGGTVTIGGGTATTFNVGTGSNDDVMLGQQATNNATTFNVGVTGAAGGDLIVNTPLINNFTVSGTAASSGLIKTGAGTMVLGAANGYSGGTTLSAGTLQFDHATGGIVDALGSTSGTVTFSSNSTLQAGVSGTLSNVVSINSSVTGTFDTQGNTVTLSQATAGAGNLTKIGSGALILTTASNLPSTSSVTILSGTLGLAAANELAVAPGTPTTDLYFAGNSTLQADVSSSNFTVANRVFQINSGVAATINVQNFDDTLNGTIIGSGGLVVTGSNASGAGQLSLYGSNSNGYDSYTGGTTILSGTLQLGNAGALGSSSGSLAVNGGTLDMNGNSVSVGLLSGSGAGLITSGVSGSITLTGSSASNGTYGGTIRNGSATIALTKAGSGTLTLSGSDNYTGATTVSAGALVVSGSLSGTISASVAAGATLEDDGLINTSATNTVNGTIEGTGSIGAVKANGGTVAPGLTSANGTLSTGFLTANGAVTLSSTTNFNIRLGAGAGGTDSDELVEGGSGTVGLSGTLNLALGQGMRNLTAASIDHLYYVIINGGSSQVTGTFAGLANNSTISVNGYSFEIFYNTDAAGNSDAGTGNDVVLELTAVPEPGSWATLLIGFGVLLAFHGMRKHRVGTGGAFSEHKIPRFRRRVAPGSTGSTVYSPVP